MRGIITLMDVQPSSTIHNPKVTKMENSKMASRVCGIITVKLCMRRTQTDSKRNGFSEFLFLYIFLCDCYIVEGEKLSPGQRWTRRLGSSVESEQIQHFPNTLLVYWGRCHVWCSVTDMRCKASGSCCWIMRVARSQSHPAAANCLKWPTSENSYSGSPKQLARWQEQELGLKLRTRRNRWGREWRETAGRNNA